MTLNGELRQNWKQDLEKLDFQVSDARTDVDDFWIEFTSKNVNRSTEGSVEKKQQTCGYGQSWFRMTDYVNKKSTIWNIRKIKFLMQVPK